MIRFYFDEAKAVETLVYIANAWPNISPFYVSKVVLSPIAITCVSMAGR
jgi:hypothetical protein